MRKISKVLLIALIICLLLAFAACPKGDNSNSGGLTDGEQNNDGTQNSGGEENSGGEQDNGEGEVLSMKIIIGNKEFSATLYDTTSAQAFAKLLPMTLSMSELNGNEKYKYLSTALPTNSESVGTINAGDIMLYGDNCIVLFYKSFTTRYSYTRIGKIENVAGLQQAVGSGSVSVTFQAK